MISRRALFSQFALLAVGGGAAWWLRDQVLWPKPVARFGPGGTSGWLPFLEPDKGVVTVAATVAGAHLEVLIDSGAQSSVIDRALAASLGLATTTLGPLVIAFGVSGGPQFGRVAALDLEIGALKLQGLRAAVLDIASVSAASDRRFDLILGQDALRVLAAEIDFPGQRLSLGDRSTYRPPAGSRPVGARAQGHGLLVPVTVENVRLEVALDTGATAVLALSRETAKTAGLLDGRPMGSAPSVGFGGLVRDRVVQAARVDFADQHWSNLPVHIFEPGRGAPTPAGLLGLEALQKFRVGLDLAGGRLDLSGGPLPYVPLVRTS